MTTEPIPDGVPLADAVSEIKRQYEFCFGCGDANPLGLRLGDFVKHGDSITASFTPQADFRGFEGVLHGGIVMAALDEVMAWTAMIVEGVFVVTGTLDVRFAKTAPVDTTYEMHGAVEKRRGKRLMINGEMRTDGSAVASARGLFIADSRVNVP